VFDLGDEIVALQAPILVTIEPQSTAILLIPSDFVVHSFRPPMEEAMSRLWSQLG